MRKLAPLKKALNGHAIRSLHCINFFEFKGQTSVGKKDKNQNNVNMTMYDC